MESSKVTSLKRRSRSPAYHHDARRERRRSGSPQRRQHKHHHSSLRTRGMQWPLPFQAQHLHRQDLEIYKPMFGLYLDIQKQLVLEDLKEEEMKGRWKSFVGRWNRGDLAEGWYDPATLRRAQDSATAIGGPPTTSHPLNTLPSTSDAYKGRENEGTDESSEEDQVGPTLPGMEAKGKGLGKRPGPAVPNTQDLALKRELEQEDIQMGQEELYSSRKIDRKLQKEHLEELVPRAEAGSKDRTLEKKREKADANRAFASAKTEAGGVEEVPESDLLGVDDGGIEGFKKRKKLEERKKNERELRKEEILRARKEERDERVRAYQAKEEKTMSGLVALAKARFG